MRQPTAATRRSIYRRYALWLLLITACISGLAIYAAFRTIRSNSNKVADWLPASLRRNG